MQLGFVFVPLTLRNFSDSAIGHLKNGKNIFDLVSPEILTYFIFRKFMYPIYYLLLPMHNTLCQMLVRQVRIT